MLALAADPARHFLMCGARGGADRPVDLDGVACAYAHRFRHGRLGLHRRLR